MKTEHNMNTRLSSLTMQDIIKIRMESLQKKAQVKRIMPAYTSFDACDHIVTHHAYKRARQRLGWGRKTLERMLPKVLERGLCQKDFSGSFSRHLRSKLQGNGVANHLLIYGEVIYFMRDATLITLYRVPSQFIKCLPLRQCMAQAA